MRQAFVTALVVLGALLLVGCGAEGIAVEDVWVRPSPVKAGNGAAYMVIKNRGGEDDALISASADFADAVELHETTMMDAGGEGETDQEMVMMQPVPSIAVPAGGSATLAPGGYHIMLIGLKEQLEPGQTVTLTLTFEEAGEVEVEAEVKMQ